MLVRKVDVKAGDIGTNMKPVQRKDIETNMKRYWDKYENIMQQIWKDIGINMKRYWDKYETCAKKTSMTLKLFAPDLLIQYIISIPNIDANQQNKNALFNF